MSSKKTYLEIVNATKNGMNITVNHVDNHDWDGDSRPDKNFNNVNIPAFSSKREREEVNNLASGSNFNMHITFTNGDQLTLRINQQEGTKSYQKLYSSDKIGGANESDYVVFQNNDGAEDVNRFEISSKNWMRDADGNKRIHEITIPGTHDTCTYTAEAKLVPYTQCQTKSLKDQLKLGIRFVDIRCKEEHNKFQIHHGVVHLGLEFGKDVRDVCIDFLKKNPSEFIIMSVKKEKDASDSTLSFEQVLKNYISGHEAYFYTRDIDNGDFPKINEVRGKIVLVSRYKDSTIGIDADPWKDDDTFHYSSKKLRIQDKYKVGVISHKWDEVKRILKEADAENASYLYFNFCSGTGAPLWTPSNVARQVTKDLFSYVNGKGHKRYGIVIMDYPHYYHDALTRTIIGVNYRP